MADRFKIEEEKPIEPILKTYSFEDESLKENQIEGSSQGITYNVDVDTTAFKKPMSAQAALEEIQTEKFLETLRDYYEYRDGEEVFADDFKKMSHADLLEYFYNDRTWRNNNTTSMSFDLYNVFADDPERLRQFAYIQETYQSLPNFWNDPNRTFGSWLYDFGGAMIADPINFISFGVGKQVAKESYKIALKEALKGKVAKEISERAIIEAQKEATKKGLKKAVLKGAAVEGTIGAGTGALHSTLLQTTAIQSDIKDEFSLKDLGISTAAGFGFGTIFGGAFSYGGFKLTSRQQKKNTVKNLVDLHNYGRSEITGKKLFDDLTITKKGNDFYKNKTKAQIDEIEAKNKINPNETIDQRIKSLRKTAKEGLLNSEKPPKTMFNYKRMSDGTFGTTVYLKNAVKEIAEVLEEIAATKSFQFIKESAERLGVNPQAVIKAMEKFGKEGKELAATVLAHDMIILKNIDDIKRLASMLEFENLTPSEKASILKELAERDELGKELLVVKKQVQNNIAVAQAAQRINRQELNVAELIVNPENPKLAKQKIDGNAEEFWRQVAKLDSNEAIEDAMTNVRKTNSWDLAAEYVNNNLLSSPDTHILNIASSLLQTQWKPFVMLLRAANMGVTRQARAGLVAREALQTYFYQYYYLIHAIGGLYRGFRQGRPVLDALQMKVDNNIRQGQLQRWFNEWGDLLTSPFGFVGKGVNRLVWRPTSYTLTLPLRLLSAGDEFLKTMTFKARVAAQVNSAIMRENPELITSSFLQLKNRKAYRAEFKRRSKLYHEESGKGITAANVKGTVEEDAFEINDPLEYARDATYTQSAHQMAFDPKTGKRLKGNITGGLLSWTAKNRWSRVFGLHFINTPSNLIRWNLQHLPLVGRYQLQMRHMLAKDKVTGKYLNPEKAAEANARIQMGYLIWGSAFIAAQFGMVTSGGSPDYKENDQRTATTGWKPYSVRTSDGRYIALNRLDPFMTPFFIAADITEALNTWLKHNEDLPEEVENKYIDLSMSVITSLTRNFTSKFYTKNMLETADLILGDGLMKTRDPERLGASLYGRFINKFAPLSGMMRYISRVNDSWEREVWGFADRLSALSPFDDPNAVMPQRNIFGEKINRENGWLFGLGGQSGLWSSPFAMTQFKNSIVAKFFNDRDFDYTPPSKIDKHTGINLKEKRFETGEYKGQTYYDRWLEIKSEMKVFYAPLKKQASLKEILEHQITDPTSQMNKLPEGIVAGDDYKQKFLLKIVHDFEGEAYDIMFKNNDELMGLLKNREIFIKEKLNSSLQTWLKAVNAQK